MLHDGTYMTEDEFLSSFHMDRSCMMQLNRLIENDEVFSSASGEMSKQISMLHIMVMLIYLGNYGNEASLQKTGQMKGIFKGAVNECVKYAFSVI